MIINSAALQRKSAVIVLLVFIVLAGFSCYYSLPRENSPDITIPYIFVSTYYEGVAPEDMEKLVTIPLERKLKGLSDLKELSSLSDDGVSLIRCEFEPDIDIDDALQKVREKVDQAKPDLPSDLPDDPEINEVNLSEQPILNIILSGPYSLKRLKVFAENLEDQIESVQGVLDAEIYGGLEREIHVLFDLDRVAYYRMPLSSLMDSVESGNVNMPGGSMDIGKAKYTVRVPEDFKHPSEIENIVAFVRDGKPVYLRDVASIRDHYADPTDRSRFNGQPSVTIAVKKRSGENIIYINDAIRERLKNLQGQLPPNLKIDLTSDQSEDIRRMVADLENNIISGLILVLLVVFAFIGGRSALFVSLSIPISMLITFIALSALGITLNMVVLFSLILALGMLVDNGIVVVENVYRHMQDGKTREQAAQIATDEVAWPVISSTLTTVGAFFPMAFWPGIMGEFMAFLPKTVIIALVGSLFVALVVNPVLSSRFQTIRKCDLEKRPTRVDRFLERLKDAYLPLLEWSLENRLKTLGFAFAMLVASIAIFALFGNGVEFMPETEPQRAWIKIKAPVGTNLDTSDALVKQVEKVCAKYDDIKYTIASVGATNSSDERGTHYSLVTIEFPDIHDRSRPSSELITEIRDQLNKVITGAEIMVDKEKHGPETGAPVNLEISGEDIRVLGELAHTIRKRIKSIPGLVDLKDDFVKSKPEITVNVDKEKAALLGLDTRTIATTVKAAINGSKVGTFREGKDEYDIVARLPEKDRQSVENLRRITVSGQDGQPVPITSLARISLASGLGGINRIDQKRMVTISGEVDGRNAGEIIRDIQEVLRDVQFPRGYGYSFTGQQEEQDDASAFLGKAFVATIFIIFLVLVTQFNSVATPFIILTSVMLSLIGVFLGLVVTGTAFSVIMTGVGVISLAGVVVNNAIVLIDYYEQLVREGIAARTAIIQAGMTRFRPVLLTAITTVLGLLPMATGVSFDFINFRWDIGGESSQWWGPMAVAVIFGLAVATLLTLVVVPVLCSLKATYLDSRKQQA
ncbi:efflux RND transporter permease subunit [Salidesulfovibrio onnuriiensis]|uniref:efflux RND transporter permease subunit n=1 Tax=Salidesulfovibrio onnuriiensis TaxID=2583823 RepID=UPI0011CBB173|nr:efflux RND transporter permease subunit [Salidesulfovibrio onnuriiensis]